MASFRIHWKRSTKKDLRKIPKTEVEKIIRAVEDLSKNPRPESSNKLSGSEYTHRIRVGTYRIIYEIHENEVVVQIVKVGHRKDVYRQKG